MPPPELSTVYTDTDSIAGLLSAVGRDFRVDDDGSQSVDQEEQKFITWSVNYATSRVNSFLVGKYDLDDLATSWSIWNYTTVIACYWLCHRRMNAVPSALIALYNETMNDLAMIAQGELFVDDLGTRNLSMPIWANHRIDDRYNIIKQRTIGPISESTQTTVPKHPDWLSDTLTEPPIY